MGRHTATPPTPDQGCARHRRAARPVRRRFPLIAVGRLGLGAVMLVTLTASTLSNGPAGAQSAANVPTLSTVEALTSSLPAPSPPAELVSPPHHDAQDVLRASATSDEVSRSMPRATFRTDTGGTVQCSGVVPDIGTNGHVPDESLCDLWQKPYRDRADAVVTLTKLNDAHTAKFGEPMCLTSGYRTLEEQAALRRKEPGLAAPAGLSNHGWGLAVDFCKETYTGIHGTWLRANAATYDWDNPAWARRGGSGPYEPWHWEYETGVNALVAAGLEK